MLFNKSVQNFLLVIIFLFGFFILSSLNPVSAQTIECAPGYTAVGPTKEVGSCGSGGCVSYCQDGGYRGQPRCAQSGQLYTQDCVGTYSSYTATKTFPCGGTTQCPTAYLKCSTETDDPCDDNEAANGCINTICNENEDVTCNDSTGGCEGCISRQFIGRSCRGSLTTSCDYYKNTCSNSEWPENCASDSTCNTSGGGSINTCSGSSCGTYQESNSSGQVRDCNFVSYNGGACAWDAGPGCQGSCTGWRDPSGPPPEPVCNNNNSCEGPRGENNGNCPGDCPGSGGSCSSCGGDGQACCNRNGQPNCVNGGDGSLCQPGISCDGSTCRRDDPDGGTPDPVCDTPPPPHTDFPSFGQVLQTNDFDFRWSDAGNGFGCAGTGRYFTLFVDGAERAGLIAAGNPSRRTWPSTQIGYTLEPGEHWWSVQANCTCGSFSGRRFTQFFIQSNPNPPALVCNPASGNPQDACDNGYLNGGSRTDAIQTYDSLSARNTGPTANEPQYFNFNLIDQITGQTQVSGYTVGPTNNNGVGSFAPPALTDGHRYNWNTQSYDQAYGKFSLSTSETWSFLYDATRPTATSTMAPRCYTPGTLSVAVNAVDPIPASGSPSGIKDVFMTLRQRGGATTTYSYLAGQLTKANNTYTLNNPPASAGGAGNLYYMSTYSIDNASNKSVVSPDYPFVVANECITAWLQAEGDVHTNSTVNTPGGPAN